MSSRTPSSHVNLIDDRVFNAPDKTRSIYWDDDATLVGESPTEDRFLPPIPFSPHIPGPGSDRSALVIPPLTEFGTPITSTRELPRAPFNSSRVAAPRSPIVASRATPQSSRAFPIPPRVRASSTFGHTHGGSSGGRPPAMPPTPLPAHPIRPSERTSRVPPITPTNVPRAGLNRPNVTDPTRGPRQRSISLAPAASNISSQALQKPHYPLGMKYLTTEEMDERNRKRKEERSATSTKATSPAASRAAPQTSGQGSAAASEICRVPMEIGPHIDGYLTWKLEPGGQLLARDAAIRAANQRETERKTRDKSHKR
ncbi:unnamed protein product [Cyclocybe aegerita]|uniref:Uncharacterized protein n=1 Tax=Cyclocybe aegerita TaxID=1973307 RepID=A0A8S0W183_CYCAE|nr:unnamed protein product [Cyclocybe aegerita]